MKLLILCGQLYPTESNNTKLLSKLLPFLQNGNELRLVASYRAGKTQIDPPSSYCGIPVSWVSPDSGSALGRLLYSAYSKLADKNGHSDAILTHQYRRVIRALRRTWRFSALLSVTEPFPAAAAGALRARGVKKAIYFMDPPPSVRGLPDTPYRSRCFRKILKRYDGIASTPFFRAALSEHGFGAFAGKTLALGFPMVTAEALRQPGPKEPGQISLLFTGWMCSDIRSPKYFLDIVSRLDERFVVTFMGRECGRLQKRFPTQTRAKLITLPQQPYETALQAMADADILINIGNSVSVHMPSKTLEYINTGKPIVNFYKMDDCPTLYYTKRYPLCLNLPENDPDLDGAAAHFIDFCLSSRGKTLDRQFIEAEYADCTPEFIANRLLEALNAPEI